MVLLTHTDRTATVAWSPSLASLPQPLLAAATVSGALDASFSTATTLELFDPLSTSSENSNTPSFKVIGSVTAAARFNRLAWGTSPDIVRRPMGILAGGLENGDMALWDPKIITDNFRNGTTIDPFIMRPVKHKGAVRGLDFNPVDSKFLASGATDGELFIWDLTNPSKPYSPGARSTRLDDVTAVSWNRMYHYILASASNNGNTVIWDLRNRNEIAAFSHPGGRRQISSIAWNPNSPTQVATASDDDATPVILMWDLRNSRAPEKVLTGHSKGVLNLAWCPKDSDLLLSCGKDNRTIVWNPSGTGTVIGDLHHSTNWSFEAQWCHRNPDLVAIAGFDGTVSVHSLQDDFFNQTFPSLQHQPSHISNSKFRLPHPPKWLRRPVGASWGFGNRLVRFGTTKHADGTRSQTISIRSVISEPAFAARAQELEKINAGGTVEDFIRYCTSMAKPEGGAAISEKDRDLWRFLGVMFETGSREQVLQFLGFDKADVATTDKLAALLRRLLVSTESEVVSPPPVVEETPAADVDANGVGVTDGFNGFEGGEGGDDFALIAAQNKQRVPTPVAAPVPTPAPAVPFKLYSSLPGESSDTDALITKAVVLGNFETAARICFGANRLADALMFAICGGQDLLTFAQQEYFKRLKNEKSYVRLLNNIVNGDLEDIVQNAQIDVGEADWKDVLALICTYGRNEDLPALFSALGRRLEAIATAPLGLKAAAPGSTSADWKSREEKKFAAVLCYLVAGDLAKVLNIWALRESEEEKLMKTVKNAKALLTSPKSSHNLALQSLIEKVQVFRQAIEFVDVELVNGVADPEATQYSLDTLYQRYLEYAQVAANQGLLTVAWKALELIPEAYQSPKAADPLAADVLKDRLYNSGLVRNAVNQPRFPFEFLDITKPVVAVPAPVFNDAAYGQQNYGYQQHQQYNNTAAAAAPQWMAKTPSIPGYPAANIGYAAPIQQSPYGHLNGGNHSYGNQGGYSGYSQPQPRAAFAPPPPPTVNTGAQYGAVSNQYQQSQVAPPTAASSNYYQQQHGPPPPAVATFGGVPPPVAARSVSHSAQYAAPQPQSMQPNSTWAGGVPPPTSSSVPPQQQQQQQKPEVPAGPKRHSSGDRTHITPAHLPIVIGLDSVMSVCKESKTLPQQKREWEDTEKKVLNLFDQINNSEVAEDILAKLAVLVKALQNREYSAAHKIQVELMTTKFTATSSWIVGVKRVIDTLERAELDKQQAQHPAVQQQQPPSQYGVRPGQGVAPPPPAAAATSPYGNVPPPSAYGRPAAVAPPPVAGQYGAPQPPAPNQYGTPATSLPPPPQAANQYARPAATLPPPPPAASSPYGGNAQPAPPPAANQYGNVAPPPARAAFSPTATAPAQPYGGQQLPPPLPAVSALPPPPLVAASGYGLNPYGGQHAPPPQHRPAPPPPPPTAASNPYGGQQQHQQQYGGNQGGYY
ncbi:UNVERIFIED_CONTAM: protein transport protein S31 [Siphonaria sp. JEL0065]|nr:protein transport protein S31 [Siphonaria sp. JEL0065]